MSIINGFAMGVSALLKFMGYPSPSAYNNIKVYGSNTIDYIHIKNVEMTEAEMLATPYYIDPTWDGNTIFLALFQMNLNGGNITGLVNPITEWEVQRKKSTETAYKTIALLPSTSTSFLDLTTESGVVYNYQIFATNDTEISEPLSNNLNSEFYSHVLIDAVTNVAVVFDLNLEFDGYGQETAMQRYDGYDKYSTYSFGERRFKTGSARAIVSDNLTIDYELVQTIDYLKTVDEFLNNGNDKIMKDRKGNAIRVKTINGMTQTPLNISISQQPYVISFDFEECGEIDG